MKNCPRCKQTKELFLFHKDIKRKDGLAALCKRCHNDICMAGKRKNKDKYVKYQREYRKTYKAPYIENNPNALLANRTLQYAVRSGKMKRLPCEICGNEKSVGHHPFYRYFEPLKVKWLCNIHHRETHAKEKDILNDESRIKIEQKNQQMQRVEKTISFYLDYHHVESMAKMRILGNLLMVFKRELDIKEPVHNE